MSNLSITAQSGMPPDDTTGKAAGSVPTGLQSGHLVMAVPLAAPALAARALGIVLRSPGPAGLMAALHALALEGTGATVSVLLLPTPEAGGGYRVASASGLAEASLDLWTAAVEDLADRLGTRSVVLAPLSGSEAPLGLLVLGFDGAPPDRSAIDVLADAFALALERGRQQRESDLDRDLREALLVFARGSESPAAMATSLAAFCRRVTWLLGADTAKVWQHDRKSRELALVATSDGARLGARIPTSDEAHPAVRGLRQPHAMALSESTGQPDAARAVTLTVPLQGRRRALGTLLLTGVRLESGGETDLLVRVEQIGRGLAASLENGQLLHDVLRSAERLAHTEKVLALGQFVAGVAHELNNPLQGVLGHLELVRASPSLPASLKRDLGLVYREADRAARIVRNLLVFAGSGRLRTRSMNLNLLAGRVLRLRARALDRARIDVVREFDASLPLVKADGLLLQQAVLNVVLNAEQAMDGQPGRLVVRTEFDPGRRGARLVIEDSGPGLGEDVRSRLFEPFFSTKEVGKGTGLGLAIAFGILQAHGGSIEADNHPDRGARFILTLPIVK
jgi:signal transduction histidine kinase